MVVHTPAAHQAVHQVREVISDVLAIGHGKVRHECLASRLVIHLQQHPEVHVRFGFQHLEGFGLSGKVENLPAFGRLDAHNVVRQVAGHIQHSYLGMRIGVLRLQHLQADRPGDGAHDGRDGDIEVRVTELLTVAGPQGVDEKIALGQGTEVGV
ncbi:hypothetical protein D3C87_1335120 [compost metagenome]